MAEYNPFAAPESETKPEVDFSGDESGGVWRDGKVIVVRRGAGLPDRCIRCNKSAYGYRHKATLTHLHTWWILLIFLGIGGWLLLALIYFLFRKRYRIEIGVCDLHRVRRNRGFAIFFISLAIGVGLFVLSAQLSQQPESVYLILAAIVVFFGGGMYGALQTTLFRTVKIDDQYVRLGRTGRPFLDSLPDWMGTR